MQQLEDVRKSFETKSGGGGSKPNVTSSSVPNSDFILPDGMHQEVANSDSTSYMAFLIGNWKYFLLGAIALAALYAAYRWFGKSKRKNVSGGASPAGDQPANVHGAFLKPEGVEKYQKPRETKRPPQAEDPQFTRF
jgi:hypothetical protein